MYNQRIGILVICAIALLAAMVLGADFSKTIQAALPDATAIPSQVIQSEWITETIAVGNSGTTAGLDEISMAVDDEHQPHISYYDIPVGLYGTLRYAHHEGGWRTGNWISETVDSQGGAFTSLALDSMGHPHISYYIIGPTGNLKYAYWTGSNWITETLPVTAGVGGSGFDTVLALDGEDKAHIVYPNYAGYNNESLVYVHWTGSEWITQTIDNQGRSPSLALDSNDNPHVSYYDRNNGLLKYARWTGNQWLTETVDVLNDSSYDTSLALDNVDNPHIVYHVDEQLRYAHWAGSQWLTETVDMIGNVGWQCYPSLALDSLDHPHISYIGYSNQSELRYAYWAGAWVTHTVAWEGVNETVLALDAYDQPYLAYYVFPTRELKIARQRHLYIAKESTPQASRNLTYTITLTNAGGLTFTASITDWLPAQVVSDPTFVTWTASVAPGATWTKTLLVTLEMHYSGTLTNVVEAATTDELSVSTHTIAVVEPHYIYLPITLRNCP